MKLIIGGAYQGKLAYAKKEYHLTEGWLDGGTCPPEAILSCSGIYNFHEYVKRMVNTDNIVSESEQFSRIFLQTDNLSGLEQQAEAFAEMLCRKNPDIVIISNELGYGVVPMEKEDRLWREAVGRICTGLASRADEVIRVVCGMGQRLK
ncbi:MAG: bifunctional adenosylcobinamide kinase/adenosylcobinamide-phosphate guanylyltransferase [Lachnospiraceae bacterium]|nr:bifunctional adenosylcobinamide kinase/adenosylcobinamide-phosphate guanylyltransferase [Lachnospiraceae bacterium]